MAAFFGSLPGAIAQGIIWGIMAIGVYITYKVLDLADLTVDGSLATGGAVFVVLSTSGVNMYLALLAALVSGCLAGLATGVWESTDEIEANREVDKIFVPSMPEDLRNKKYSDWKRAVERSRNWER